MVKSYNNLFEKTIKDIHEKMNIAHREGRKYERFKVDKEFLDNGGLTESGIDLKMEVLKTYRSFKFIRQKGAMGGTPKFEIGW